MHEPKTTKPQNQHKTTALGPDQDRAQQIEHSRKRPGDVGVDQAGCQGERQQGFLGKWRQKKDSVTVSMQQLMGACFRDRPGRRAVNSGRDHVLRFDQKRKGLTDYSFSLCSCRMLCGCINLDKQKKKISIVGASNFSKKTKRPGTLLKKLRTIQLFSTKDPYLLVGSKLQSSSHYCKNIQKTTRFHTGSEDDL